MNRVFWFSLELLSDISLNKRKIQRDIVTNAVHVRCPLLLSDFNQIFIFTTDPRKILKYKIS